MPFMPKMDKYWLGVLELVERSLSLGYGTGLLNDPKPKLLAVNCEREMKRDAEKASQDSRLKSNQLQQFANSTATKT